MTRLIASAFLHEPSDLRCCAPFAQAGGAEMLELRLDGLRGDLREVHAGLRGNPLQQWILTCRPESQGGRFRGSPKDQLDLLLAASAGTQALIDLELATWTSAPDVRARLDQHFRDGRYTTRLILSLHDFERTPPDLPALLAPARDCPHLAAVKVAVTPRDWSDVFRVLDLLHQSTTPLVAIAMGDLGLITRVLASKLGAWGTYVALDAGEPTAPGQPTLQQVKEMYRWDAISPGTRLLGLIGDPVAHSLSPLLHNAWCAAAGFDAVFLPLRVPAGPDALCQFLDGLAARDWLDPAGFSVTVPHKVAAYEWLGPRADRTTARAGAINTLVPRSGHWSGYNTDGQAAVASLAAALGVKPTQLCEVTVDMLGSGGAARELLDPLTDLGCRPTVYARNPAHLRELANRFGCPVAPWSHRSGRTGQVVINCTPVGMWPEVDATPLEAAHLDRGDLVFDLIYNPPQTRLLREAAAAGCRTLNGLDMFLRQAAVQFALWTGHEPDIATVRPMIEAALRRPGDAT